MRLKYFLRGLGIGIAVTTIILAISHNANRRMSDSEVIERARELGMTYTTPAQESSSDNGASQEDTQESDSMTEESTKESDETSSDEESSDDISSGEPSSSENASETETSTEEEASSVQETSSVRETTSAQPVTETTTPQETTTQETTTQETQTETENVTEPEAGTVVTYTLTIASGMSSNTVCEMLKRAGIIENPADFDNFLVGNGYADRIRVGSFEVNSGMSYEELAAAFCSR